MVDAVAARLQRAVQRERVRITEVEPLLALGDHDRLAAVRREVEVVRDRRPGSARPARRWSGSIGVTRRAAARHGVERRHVPRRARRVGTRGRWGRCRSPASSPGRSPRCRPRPRGGRRRRTSGVGRGRGWRWRCRRRRCGRWPWLGGSTASTVGTGRRSDGGDVSGSVRSGSVPVVPGAGLGELLACRRRDRRRAAAPMLTSPVGGSRAPGRSRGRSRAPAATTSRGACSSDPGSPRRSSWLPVRPGGPGDSGQALERGLVVADLGLLVDDHARRPAAGALVVSAWSAA